VTRELGHKLESQVWAEKMTMTMTVLVSAGCRIPNIEGLLCKAMEEAFVDELMRRNIEPAVSSQANPDMALRIVVWSTQYRERLSFIRLPPR
jgi:hypothetical protein